MNRNLGENNLPLVSVIIPVYNTQDYIKICIESILQQTYQNFEIICISDGSTDQSVDIIHRMMLNDDRIQLIEIENHGQGYARNMALGVCHGDFVVFLDSDDYLESLTFELCIERIIKDQSDFAVFDWYSYRPIGGKVIYSTQNQIFQNYSLIGEECKKLFTMFPIFSVNKFYRTEFLKNNHILFGEGYIYEDAPFWIKAVLNANKISLIHSPLYRFTINPTSSTRKDRQSSWHADSFIKSLEVCWEIIGKDSIGNKDYPELYFGFFQKFLDYYKNRCPKDRKKSFLKQFVDLYSVVPLSDINTSRLYRYLLDNNVFNEKKYLLFQLCVFYINCIKPRKQKYKKKMKAFLTRVKNKKPFRWFFKKQKPSLQSEYHKNLKLSLYNNVILFFGFDNRYTGNSRYLFEDLLKSDSGGKEIFFITKNPMVPLQYRIAPYSERYYRFLARARIIIFESWTPQWMQKRTGTVWIQLWHGTPIKRLLFDSNEQIVTKNNPRNKNGKFADIQKWDYLLTDSIGTVPLFHSCFLFPPKKMIVTMYPRVKYLVEHRDDAQYCIGLKNLYDLPSEKKLVLYLPTWRDYNYKIQKEEFDTSYLLDIVKLQSILGESYYVIYKDHVFLSPPDNSGLRNFSNCETQELLLVADYLITDFSSVLFDAISIDLPILLYCKDIEKNEEVRGTYSKVFDSLEMLCCDDEEEICDKIVNGDIPSLPADFCERFGGKKDGVSLKDIILNI